MGSTAVAAAASTLWYHHAGTAADDVHTRRIHAPWYRHKRHIAGVLDPVAGLPDTHLLLADGVGRLDRPAHRVSLDDLRGRGALVEGEQRQVVGLGRVRFADEHAPPQGVAETAVPGARR